MDAKARHVAEDQIEIRLTVSKGDIATLVAQLTVEDEVQEEAEARTPKYCCVCSNGDKKTIRADGDIAAFFKCLDRCGPDFSLSSGRCRD